MTAIKKIIVTGAGGFLRSNLCLELLKSGHRVTGVDNLLTGSKGNISELQKYKAFDFLQTDVCNDLPDLGQVDEIYHLASPASPNMHSKTSYHALPFETMLVNTTGTWKMAEYAINHQARLLFSSTSEVYGEPLEHPQKETYRGNVSTTGPRSVYDEAKRYGETIIAAFVRSRQLDGRIIRIFNTYGPRMIPDDGRVVSEFMYAALADKTLRIFGNGKQTRSFCYVDDLIRGMIAVMEKVSLAGEVINLGNPDEFTIYDLARKVVKITGSRSEIEFCEAMQMDDPSRRRPDISRASALLGWSPQINLEMGLKLYWEYIKKEKR